MKYRNPILSGFHPDPSICRVGEDFYLVNSTFEYFPGLPIHHSRDLVHWELLGNALDRPSQLSLGNATDHDGLYAPTIRYGKGTFYLTCTNVRQGGNFIVKAKDPRGPWSEPVWMDDHNIDGSMFFDEDGKAYYTQHAGGERAGILQSEFDPETGRFTTTPKLIYNDPSEPWNEGPHLYKVGGLYYLMLAKGGTGTQHMEWIGRSPSPWGPFEPCPFNPILTHRDIPDHPIQCTGHADLVEAPDGTWWAVFLGVRFQNGTSVLGRETFLAPVEWKEGWPVVHGDHHVALEMEGPRLAPHPVRVPGPHWDFDEDRLGPEWLHVRNLDPNNLSLTRHPGALSLRAGKGSLRSCEEIPVFAGQRQPDFKVTARCVLDFTPREEGEEAGLMVRSNDDHHYEVGVGRRDGGNFIWVRNRVMGQEGLVSTRPFEGGRVHLELSGREDQYRFAWSKDGKVWEVLGASDAADLSKERAWGFTGAVIGMYATAEGKHSENWAAFERFEMIPGVAPDPIPLTPLPPPPGVAPRSLWRINAGGTAVTDPEGNLWEADDRFVGGDVDGVPQGADLLGSERNGIYFKYIFPVLPGRYRVRLLFSERVHRTPRERWIECSINDRTVLRWFDILEEAGGPGRKVEKVFGDVQPDTQGLIVIRLMGRAHLAQVCGIEIRRED